MTEETEEVLAEHPEDPVAEVTAVEAAVPLPDLALDLQTAKQILNVDPETPEAHLKLNPKKEKETETPNPQTTTTAQETPEKEDPQKTAQETLKREDMIVTVLALQKTYKIITLLLRRKKVNITNYFTCK